MSDSIKLRFEHGIWCLIFSYVFLAISVASILLMIFISGMFFILLFLGCIAFIILISAAIEYFKEAIAISKKEGTKEKNI